MPALYQIVGHRPAHDAEPDKTDLHDASPLLVRRWGSMLDCATVLQFRPRSQADRAAEPILARYLASRPRNKRHSNCAQRCYLRRPVPGVSMLQALSLLLLVLFAAPSFAQEYQS